MDVSIIQHGSPQAEILREAAVREAAARTAPSPVSRDTVNMELVLSELQQVSQAFNRRLSFALNEKLDQVVVKVIDSDRKSVV